MKETRLTPTQIQSLISWYEEIFCNLQETKDFSNTLMTFYESHLANLYVGMGEDEKARVIAFMQNITQLFTFK